MADNLLFFTELSGMPVLDLKGRRIGDAPIHLSRIVSSSEGRDIPPRAAGLDPPSPGARGQGDAVGLEDGAFVRVAIGELAKASRLLTRAEAAFVHWLQGSRADVPANGWPSV